MTLVISVAVALCFVGWWVWVEYATQKDEERALQEWMDMFPGRCAFCAWHRYGRHFGHETSEVPPPHDCPEGR